LTVLLLTLYPIGRNIPTVSETFELEDMKRSACYAMEEEE
jgi:hypothetical protein